MKAINTSGQPSPTTLTYAEFVTTYEQLVKTFLGYKTTEVGSEVFASKLADLVDAYPEFSAQYDDQN